MAKLSKEEERAARAAKIARDKDKRESRPRRLKEVGPSDKIQGKTSHVINTPSSKKKSKK